MAKKGTGYAANSAVIIMQIRALIAVVRHGSLSLCLYRVLFACVSSHSHIRARKISCEKFVALFVFGLALMCARLLRADLLVLPVCEPLRALRVPRVHGAFLGASGAHFVVFLGAFPEFLTRNPRGSSEFTLISACSRENHPENGSYK